MLHLTKTLKLNRRLNNLGRPGDPQIIGRREANAAAAQHGRLARAAEAGRVAQLQAGQLEQARGNARTLVRLQPERLRYQRLLERALGADPATRPL